MYGMTRIPTIGARCAAVVLAATLCGSCFPRAAVAQEGKSMIPCAPGKWPPLGPTPGAITTATSPLSLLQNIREAVESHWFETQSLYADDELKAMFGVMSLERHTVPMPAYPPMNRPAGMAEYIRANGRMPMPGGGGGGDKLQYLEYSLDLGRALSGELVNHLLRKMQIRISRYEQNDAPVSYQQVVLVFGKGTDPGWSASRPTDGALPKASEIFYTCATKSGQESLIGEIDHDGTVDQIEFDVATGRQ
jgi:hypothetical protein